MSQFGPVTAAQFQQYARWVHETVVGLNYRLLDIRRRLYAIEAERLLTRAGRKPRVPVEFRSQFGEDCAVWELLGGQLDGFYIEVGAFDGRGYAVSYALDAMGWNGLLIEAIPDQYEKCRKNRPNARVVHAALGRSGSTGTTRFTVTEDEYGGMLSFHDPKSSHARDMASRRYVTHEVEVPFTSMNELLQGHTGPIDVASIDVEGTELAVLDGFDLDRYRPRILLLEDNEKNEPTPLARFMQGKPYIEVGKLDASRLYVHKGEEQLLRRAKGLPTD